jgi:drug/metabolite transporter (DMT)-like permease
MVMRGPRYLLAAEVSLLLLLETVLGPVWVWVALGEAPSVRDALTAAVIVVALAVSALQATAAVDSPVHGRPRGQ